jgi:heavy metal sensor kinase
MRSTSGRLTTLFTILFGILLGVFAIGVYLWVENGLERSLERDLAIQSAQFQERFLAELDEARRGASLNLGEELTSFLAISGAKGEVTDSAGAPLFRSPEFASDLPGYRTETARLADPRGGEFRVRFALREEPYREPLRQLRLYGAIFLPLILLLAAALGVVLTRRALSPMEELRRHAERISRMNLSERIPASSERGELGDLAHTFNEMLDRLEAAVDDLKHLAADAAHELRTPLANLRAEIETTVQKIRTPEEYETVLVSISEEVARMTRVVADLLTLAKLDLRQYALEKSRVPLRSLLEEARETWQAAAREKGIEIGLEGSDVDVQGDPAALGRVFMNLVENAVKYNRQGGSVKLSLDRTPDAARVRVADTGVGIDPAHLPKLFRRFSRADRARSRETGGAGLGLAIAKSFIDAHGGSITVTSSQATGTLFTIELPTAPEDPSFRRIRSSG